MTCIPRYISEGEGRRSQCISDIRSLVGRLVRGDLRGEQTNDDGRLPGASGGMGSIGIGPTRPAAVSEDLRKAAIDGCCVCSLDRICDSIWQVNGLEHGHANGSPVSSDRQFVGGASWRDGRCSGRGRWLPGVHDPAHGVERDPPDDLGGRESEATGLRRKSADI